MKIIETEINDIYFNNDIDSKLNLSDTIISYIQPIFTSSYNIKVREITEMKKSLIMKKEKIQEEKNILSFLLNDFSKIDREKQLLEKMGKLIQHDLIQESMKTEMVKMLNSFETLPEQKIISYLNEIIRILSQKFAKT